MALPAALRRWRLNSITRPRLQRDLREAVAAEGAEARRAATQTGGGAGYLSPPRRIHGRALRGAFGHTGGGAVARGAQSGRDARATTRPCAAGSFAGGGAGGSSGLAAVGASAAEPLIHQQCGAGSGVIDLASFGSAWDHFCLCAALRRGLSRWVRAIGGRRAVAATAASAAIACG
eukprot:1958961-Pleurochrysis_carterae.AAC.1